MSRRKWTALLTTALLITIAAVRFHQSFLRILPVYVSLVIALMQSNVSRYAPLIGGLNSFLYGLVYYHYGLYGSTAYAVGFSAPLQICTYFLWSKRPYAHSTVLKSLTHRQRTLAGAAFAVSFGTLALVLSLFHSQYLLYDNAVTLMGVCLTVLTMLRFREYSAIQVINACVHLVLYARMSLQYPEQITYTIYGVYLVACALLTARNVNKLYAQQQMELKGKTA